MRAASWLPLWACLIASNLSAGVVRFLATELNVNHYRFDYSVSGITLQVGQELDIRFDPGVFGTLSNPHSPAGVSTLVLQPNNPPGISGDFTIMPLSGSLSLLSPLSIEAVTLGSGPPGSQPFFINQYDSGGNFLFIVEGGFTETGTHMPEPAVPLLVGMGLLAGGVWRHIRKRTLAAPPGN